MRFPAICVEGAISEPIATPRALLFLWTPSVTRTLARRRLVRLVAALTHSLQYGAKPSRRAVAR
jgi:hypothetical protein